MHNDIQLELTMLKERYPNITELTFDEYADYFGISRRHASQHFNRINAGRHKISHKRIGKKTIIPMIDFAYWLAQQKVVNGRPLELYPADKKRARGFCQPKEYA